MGEGLASWSERRRAMRVPVRGTAILQSHAGALHGTVENLSRSGALLHVLGEPVHRDHELELRLIDGSGTISARTVRIEEDQVGAGWRIAVAFDRVDSAMRASIDASIDAALSAARRRPILVIDADDARRVRLMDRLIDRGMTPLAPRTPLEMIDLLTRAQLQISVCMMIPGADLETVLADSFPWVTTSAITDDVDATVSRALETWSTTPVARLGVAIG
ncbi:hypothetical protein BH11MYX3_BH11MYX3_18460 [soil metagenome]